MKARVVAIVPCAGYGKRLRLKAKKPFVTLNGKPLAIYALKALDSSSTIDAIIIAAESSCVERFKNLVKRYGLKKVTKVVIGGSTRSESVKNCLDAAGPSFDIALIHDGARPLVEKKTIEDVIRFAERYGACITAVPETDTVKLVGGGLFIKKTLDRRKIFRAQTPQAFRMNLIKQAYSESRTGGATDDAGLLEAMGERVKILEGSYRNMKVTTKEDLKIAGVLL